MAEKITQSVKEAFGYDQEFVSVAFKEVP
ncbi:tautomerase family protein [Methylophilus sp. Leaf414]